MHTRRSLKAADAMSHVVNDADTVIVNANVITMDSSNSTAQSVAIRDGRIVAVGSREDMAAFISKRTKLIDLKQRTLLPGFIDAHAHLLFTGLWLSSVDLSETNSVRAVIEKVRAYAKKFPDSRVILGFRLDDAKFPEKRYPTRFELDEAVPDRYVGLSHVTGHAVVVNTKSLRYLGFRGNEPGVDTNSETGEPTGVVRDPAVMEVQDKLMGLKTDEELKGAIRSAAEDAARVGLTTIHTVGEPLGKRGLRIVSEMAERIPLRVLIYPLVSGQMNRDLEETPGKAGLKIIADGAIETHTAGLYEPYTDDPTTKGMLYYTQESMNELVLSAHMANVQLAIHCESDTTIDQVLDAYENALKKRPSGDHRHRIEHYELSTDEQNKRVARLGISLSMQPAFIYLWGGPDGKYAQYLGKERMKRAHTYKSLLGLAIPIAGGSDSFVTPWNPILGIHALVNHPDSEQRVNVRDALKIFTTNGARIGFEEDKKGSIEVGKFADLVVLSKDPYACKPDEILGIEIMMTIVDGKIVYEKNPQ